MTYTLTRLSQSDEGTFGQLADDNGIVLCETCEPPPDVPHPCIPAGTYHCIPHNSPKHPATWEITNVPGRSEILIHSGNTDEDTLGCVIVGMKMGWEGTQQAVLESLAALNKLRQILPAEFDLTIIDGFTQTA